MVVSMIYLFTALYCEAELFIKKFRLEKVLENVRLQEFYQEEAGIRLTVTGVGEIAAAAAVSSTCTACKPREGDMLLNVGTCAHIAGNQGVFLCNKILEQTTGKTFYPDLLYRHHLQEERIVTGMLPCNSEENLDGTLYDMEAAAIYQAGAYFFGPHQMMFLKVVSDQGAAKEVSKEKVMHLMETYQEMLFDFIGGLSAIAYAAQRNAESLQQKEIRMETLFADLHCSKAMRDALRQHLHYWELAGREPASVIGELYREGLLPCKDKREGKLCFEEIRRRLF